MRKKAKNKRKRPTMVAGEFSSHFGKYRGIGNPAIPSGKKAINKWLREFRGN